MLRTYIFKRKEKKKPKKKRKKKAFFSGWQGRAVKVFEKKILPERVEIFFSKPVGLDLY